MTNTIIVSFWGLPFQLSVFFSDDLVVKVHKDLVVLAVEIRAQRPAAPLPQTAAAAAPLPLALRTAERCWDGLRTSNSSRSLWKVRPIRGAFQLWGEVTLPPGGEVK